MDIIGAEYAEERQYPNCEEKKNRYIDCLLGICEHIIKFHFHFHTLRFEKSVV